VLSILDFFGFCRNHGIAIEEQRYLIGGRWMRSAKWRRATNLLAHIGLFVITR
jgi:hypothetical protein